MSQLANVVELLADWSPVVEKRPEATPPPIQSIKETRERRIQREQDTLAHAATSTSLFWSQPRGDACTRCIPCGAYVEAVLVAEYTWRLIPRCEHGEAIFDAMSG